MEDRSRRQYATQTDQCHDRRRQAFNAQPSVDSSNQACATSDDVNDAVQEALWILYRRVGTLQMVASFSGWLFALIRCSHCAYLISRNSVARRCLPAASVVDRRAIEPIDQAVSTFSIQGLRLLQFAGLERAGRVGTLILLVSMTNISSSSKLWIVGCTLYARAVNFIACRVNLMLSVLTAEQTRSSALVAMKQWSMPYERPPSGPKDDLGSAFWKFIKPILVPNCVRSPTQQTRLGRT